MMRESERIRPPEVCFSWNNPNGHSRGGLLKAGRRCVTGVPRYARLCHPLATAVDAVLPHPKRPDTLEIAAPAAREVLQDEAWVASVLESLPPRADRLATARSAEFLRWRYGGLDAYHALRCDADGGAPGLAIFRLHRHGRYAILQVCELLVAERDAHTARTLLRAISHAAHADFIECAFEAPLRATMCGFAPLPHGAVLTTTPPQRNGIPDPADGHSWALSLGDLELL
jgi:hypothetical protein